jgi:hypothetical protein
MVDIKTMTEEQANAVQFILEQVEEAVPDIIEGWYDASVSAQTATMKGIYKCFGDTLKSAYETVYKGE